MYTSYPLQSIFLSNLNKNLKMFLKIIYSLYILLNFLLWKLTLNSYKIQYAKSRLRVTRSITLQFIFAHKRLPLDNCTLPSPSSKSGFTHIASSITTLQVITLFNLLFLQIPSISNCPPL